MWDIPFQQNKETYTNSKVPIIKINNELISVILRTDKRVSDLATYLHATCFSPVKSTFLAARKHFFISWPGLTSSLITKYFVTPASTLVGHIKQEQQGLHSTKLTQKIQPFHKTHETIDSSMNSNNKTYMDLAGRFPYKSSRNNKCILIVYHGDSNVILGQAIKIRQALTITSAWKSLHDTLNNTSATSNSWILDDGASYHLQHAMTKNAISFQLAIQTYKTHFKTRLSTLHPNFPIAEWDRLVYHTQLATSCKCEP